MDQPLQACYRHLHRYKYQLVDDYVVPTPFAGRPATTEYIDLLDDGRLLVKKGYAWDGPSGPTFDTLDFMRGSLVHDALYQLMRLGALDDSEENRLVADRMLRDICVADGMSRLRASWVFLAVHVFGASHAKLDPDAGDRIVCVPRDA